MHMLLDFYKMQVREWSKPTHVERPPVNMLDTCMIKPDPYGVVLVLGAWNYPLNLTMGPVNAAIAAGNCVVIKPSELSPHTAEAIAKLLPKYVDQECYKVVCGGVPETTQLLKVCVHMSCCSNILNLQQRVNVPVINQSLCLILVFMYCIFPF